jgi:hypothetical protein
MAGLNAYATWPSTNINANTMTVMQLVAPTNQRLRVTALEISFDGTNSANAPALVTLERQTSGTFSNTLVPPKKTNEPSGVGETLQANTKNGQSAAPTSGDVLRNWFVPVFGGLVIYPFAPGQEVMVPGGTILGVKVQTTAAVNCSGGLCYEE